MRFLIRAAVICIFSASVNGQTLTLTSSPDTPASLTSKIEGNKLLVAENSGKIITTGSYEQPAERDPSLKSYALADGGALVRENIANFLIYDSFGVVIQSISNSTGSKDGEAVSEFATDINGKTMILYNPKVMSGNAAGSRARIIGTDGYKSDIFFSSDRTIKEIHVAGSGEFIAVVTTKPGTEDLVSIIDRFGNEINNIGFDQEVTGANLYGDGTVITIYSGARVAVYEVLSGKRLAGSSFRDGVLRFADYSRADNTIIAVTGSFNGNSLSDIEVRVINISAGKIARSKFNSTVNATDLSQIRLNRSGRYTYTLEGMSRKLNLKAAF